MGIEIARRLLRKHIVICRPLLLVLVFSLVEAIAVAEDLSLSVAKQSRVATADLFMVSPRSQSEVRCLPTSDGLYTFTVVGGSSAGINMKNTTLLLWVRPVTPSGDGWYLQRPPIGGVGDVEQNDGSWRGTGQIGNRLYPPRAGDIFDVRVTAVDPKEADSLLKAQQTFHPQPRGRTIGSATNLRVVLQ